MAHCLLLEQLKSLELYWRNHREPQRTIENTIPRSPHSLSLIINVIPVLTWLLFSCLLVFRRNVSNAKRHLQLWSSEQEMLTAGKLCSIYRYRAMIDNTVDWELICDGWDVFKVTSMPHCRDTWLHLCDDGERSHHCAGFIGHVRSSTVE